MRANIQAVLLKIQGVKSQSAMTEVAYFLNFAYAHLHFRLSAALPV